MIFLISTLLLFFSLSSNSFWTLWISFEMFTLLLSSYLAMYTDHSPKSVFNYYAVQVVGSSLFLMGSLSDILMFKYLYSYLGLLLKMGAFPFHSWTFALVESLNWKSVAVMFGISKIIPVWGFFYLPGLKFFLSTFFLFIGSSVLPVFNTNISSARTAMGYSTVVHSSWLLAGKFLKKQVTFIYFFTYISLLLPLCLFFSFLKVKSIIDLLRTNSSVPVFLLLNFLGFPPFLDFFSKLMIILEFMENKMFIEVGILSLMIMFPVFIYLKFFIFSILKMSTCKDFTLPLPLHPALNVLLVTMVTIVYTYFFIFFSMQIMIIFFITLFFLDYVSESKLLVSVFV